MFRAVKKIWDSVPLMTKIQGAALLALGVFVFVWGAQFIEEFRNKKAVGEVTPAAVAPEIDDVKKETVPLTVLEVYAGGAKTKKKLGLKPEVAADKSISVVAASTVKPDYHAHEIITTVNTITGKVETVDIKKPLPWIALDTTGAAGVYGGYSDMGETVRVQAKQNFLRIKSLQLGVLASVDQPVGAASIIHSGGPRYFVGFGGEIRW